MGLKGISWFEQNVEKIVVGVFGVALLGVVAYQFVGEGNTVELGQGVNKKNYSFDRVWEEVASKAKETNAKVSTADPDPEAAKLPQGPGVFDSFTGKLSGAVSPAKKLQMAIDRPAFTLDLGTDGAAMKAEKYAGIAPPAPAQPEAASYLATIHPQELLLHEDLLKLIAPGVTAKDVMSPQTAATVFPKLDRAVVSVETTYDGTALEALLLADPDGDGPASAYPRHWWDSGRVQVMAVELQRQELLPDGTWGKESAVPYMPGRPNVLASMKKQTDAGEQVRFADLMSDATRDREQLIRPPFYSVLFGEDWVPPSEYVADLAAAPVAGNDPATTLKTRLAGIDKDIVQIQDQIRKLEADGATAPPGPNDGGRRPGLPGPSPTPSNDDGASGPKGRPGERRQAAPTRDQKSLRLEGLRKREAKLFDDRQKIVDQLTRLGVNVDAPKDVAAPAAATPAEPECSLLANTATRMWAHDLTVERGKSYRYRISLVFNNPVYGKNAALSPEQADLAKEMFVRSAPSEWSGAVTVDPETYFFITGASPETNFSSSAHASAEVFVFSAGYWRKGQVNLEPGDVIAAEVKVPDPAKVLAMVPLREVEQNPNQPMAPENQPGVRPGLPGPGPRPRDQEFNDPPPAPRQGRPDQFNRPNPAVNPDGAPADGMVPMMSRMVAQEALLLDVASTTVVVEQGITKTKTENQAFVLEDDGEIVVRTPEGDRAAMAYLRLLRSAELGEEAVRPKMAQPLVPPGGRPQPGVDPVPSGKGNPGSGGGGG